MSVRPLLWVVLSLLLIGCGQENTGATAIDAGEFKDVLNSSLDVYDSTDSDTADSDQTTPEDTGDKDASSADGRAQVDATFGDAGPLALATAWTAVTQDQDPWWPELSEGLTVCADADVLVEEQDGDQWYEVKTTYCNYWTATQPSLVAIAPGDLLRIRVYRWKILDGEGGFELTLSIGAGAKQALWQQKLAIPGKSGLWAEEILQTQAWPKGSPLYWHVQNHGINSWNLIEVSVRRPSK
ncbi:MAG TPA: hypothetical protein DCQ06_03400 [Myxococcales bacterium]|nr:hypothetical protein [Myxococcales bacterium]HAN30622.1 hypothetical protein [Myxococcales bacterium]|tara:strand:- start:271 stop:990 length:720 start_codon:yes stop_codon:yes gene_type:complete